MYCTSKRKKLVWYGTRGTELTLPLQVEEMVSQGFPVVIHLGPLVFGETSPSLAWAKAATNLP